MKAYKYAYSPHTQSSYRKYYQIDSGRLLWRAKLNSFYETLVTNAIKVPGNWQLLYRQLHN